MNKTLKEGTAVIVNAPPLWRLQILRLLQILGVLAGTLGGADILNLLQLLSPELAGWLLVSGPALAAGARPVIEFLGDWLDDGVRNNSFKIPLIALFFGLNCLFLIPSCSTFAGIGVTPEGCALATYRTEDGKSFEAGPCVGEDGKIASYTTIWTNDEGLRVRATYYLTTKRTVLYYLAPDGTWIEWSSKSGLSIGPIPTT